MIISPFHLPPFGTCQYGQYQFSGAANTVGFTVTPVYDAAKRTVVFSKYRISIEDYIFSDVSGNGTTADEMAAAADALAESVISQLNAPAYPLVINGKAFSSLDINSIGGRIVQDAAYGPMPISMDMKTFGPPTSKFVWTVEFSIPTCDDAQYDGIYEFNYRLTFNIDRSGYTKRTYAGHVKIAVTRTLPGGRNIPDNADAYREKVIPPLLIGFKRTDQTIDLDEAKTTLKFNIVDEEIQGNFPPQGVVECSSSHTCTTQGSWVRWLWTLQAEYEVVRGYGIGQAVTAFTALLKQRLTQAEKMVLGKGIPKAIVTGATAKLIPWAYEVEDVSIYGKLKARFRCQYTISGVSLEELIRSGGLWLPVIDPATKQESAPATYKEFVKKIQGPRGYASLIFRNSDDGIVDLCGPVPTIVAYTAPAPDAPPSYPLPGYPAPPNYLPAPSPPGLPPGSQYPPSQSQQQNIQSVFPAPDAQSSWMQYQCEVGISLDAGAVVGKLLPSSPLGQQSGQQGQQGQQGQSSSQSIWDALASNLPPNGSVQPSMFPPVADLLTQSADAQDGDGDTFVQQRTTPTLYLTLSGRALRAGFTIPVPQLMSVNGQTPTLVSDLSDGQVFRTGVVRNCGVPVVAAAWKIRYVITLPSGDSIPVPPNPALS